jgi:hypothetical protein
MALQFNSSSEFMNNSGAAIQCRCSISLQFLYSVRFQAIFSPGNAELPRQRGLRLDACTKMVLIENENMLKS